MNENPVVVRRRRGSAEIEQVVAEFGRSGMKPKEFCIGRDLSYSTLQRYLKKQQQGLSQKAGRLVPVELVSELAGKAGGERSWGVVLRSGRRIEMPGDWEESRLERLVELLERI